MTVDRDVWVRSMYGWNTKEPIVVLTVGGDTTLQMSPSEARKIAQDLVECAEAAEGDAFMMDFFVGMMKTDETHAAIVLADFRRWRENRASKQKKGA